MRRLTTGVTKMSRHPNKSLTRGGGELGAPSRALFLAAAPILLLAGKRPRALPSPMEARVPLKIVDFGLVLPGARLHRTIRVVNEASLPMLVKHISTSCGCTNASIHPRTIPPRGHAELRITVAVRPFPGKDDIMTKIYGTVGKGPVLLRYLVGYYARRVIRVGGG